MAKIGTGAFQGVPPLDLAYAIERLVAAGKTTRSEVVRLASERGDRIRALEAELAVLRTGVPRAAKPAALAARAPAKARVGRPAGRKATPAERTAPAAGGRVLIRSDGRRFTRTAKVAAARKLQGQYLGRLRKVPVSEKGVFQRIAKAEGVAAAIAALDKRLGTK